MKVILIVFIIALSIESPGIAQTLQLKHRHKEKSKILTTNDELIFQTKDTTYRYHHLVTVEQNQIIIASLRDSISIPISDLIRIKKFNFKKREILLPIATLGLLSAVGLVVFPIAELIASGPDEALDALGTMAILTTVSGTIVLIGLSKRKFNLTDDWEIISPTTTSGEN